MLLLYEKEFDSPFLPKLYSKPHPIIKNKDNIMRRRPTTSAKNPTSQNDANTLGQILLDHCWKEGGEEISLSEIKRLVEKGADIDFYDHVGLTPLSGLLFHKHVEGIAYLFEKNVSLTEPHGLIAKPFEEEANNDITLLKMLFDEKARRKRNVFINKKETALENLDSLKSPLKIKKATFKK